MLVFALGSTKPRKPRYVKPQAVRELEELADIANAKAHPQFAKYAPKAKYRDDTANGLTRCIIDFIRLHGGQAERINTTGVPIDRRRLVTDVLGHSRTIGSIAWRKGGGTVGSADISATINSKSVKIEVKIGNDRQSPAQRVPASCGAGGRSIFHCQRFHLVCGMVSTDVLKKEASHEYITARYAGRRVFASSD